MHVTMQRGNIPLFEVGFGLAPKDSMLASGKYMRVPGVPSANWKGSGTWAATASEPQWDTARTEILSTGPYRESRKWVSLYQALVWPIVFGDTVSHHTITYPTGSEPGALKSDFSSFRSPSL